MFSKAKAWFSGLGDGAQLAVVFIGLMLIGGLGGLAVSSWMHHNEQDSWTLEEARIVGQPARYGEHGESGTQALVRTIDSGDEIVTGVDRQAQVGHTISVYRNNDTGELWRGTPSTNPFTSRAGSTFLFAMLTPLVAFVMLFAVAGIDELITRRKNAKAEKDLVSTMDW